jgi:NTE family protein
MEKTKYRCGLVLSGGAVRGFAHAGILKAMNEAGIYPDVISGASAGSIVGALYADGYTPDEICAMFAEKSLYKFLEFIVPNKGLVKMTGLQKALLKNLRAKTFEELKLPLYVTLTDMNHARAVYFSKGELARTVIASCTIPLLFTPCLIDGITYVDGGVMNNLPMEPIESRCELLIGSNVNPVGYQEHFDSMIKLTDRAVHMIIENAMTEKKKRFHIFVEPPRLSDYGLLDMAKGKEIFDIGYEEGKRIFSEYLSKKAQAETNTQEREL